MTTRPMTCEQFDELLPDYLPDADGSAMLDARTRAAADAHLDACERCSALVGDLTAITRQAATLPPLRPGRDLWAGIAGRIEAPATQAAPTSEAIDEAISQLGSDVFETRERAGRLLWSVGPSVAPRASNASTTNGSSTDPPRATSCRA